MLALKDARRIPSPSVGADRCRRNHPSNRPSALTTLETRFALAYVGLPRPTAMRQGGSDGLGSPSYDRPESSALTKHTTLVAGCPGTRSRELFAKTRPICDNVVGQKSELEV